MHICCFADAGTEEFHDASAVWLSRPSQGSSGGTRYFSLAESEFEDAASELPEGGPGWQGAAWGTACCKASLAGQASCSVLLKL